MASAGDDRNPLVLSSTPSSPPIFKMHLVILQAYAPLRVRNGGYLMRCGAGPALTDYGCTKRDKLLYVG